MTKLSHIPMQIQKWIASLAHLFFLILGLTGICLMYIHGNFGLAQARAHPKRFITSLAVGM